VSCPTCPRYASACSNSHLTALAARAAHLVEIHRDATLAALHPPGSSPQRPAAAGGWRYRPALEHVLQRSEVPASAATTGAPVTSWMNHCRLAGRTWRSSFIASVGNSKWSPPTRAATLLWCRYCACADGHKVAEWKIRRQASVPAAARLLKSQREVTTADLDQSGRSARFCGIAASDTRRAVIVVSRGSGNPSTQVARDQQPSRNEVVASLAAQYFYRAFSFARSTRQFDRPWILPCLLGVDPGTTATHERASQL
jgi:hypothetical protein